MIFYFMIGWESMQSCIRNEVKQKPGYAIYGRRLVQITVPACPLNGREWTTICYEEEYVSEG